jgi:hypothetical protein
MSPFQSNNTNRPVLYIFPDFLCDRNSMAEYTQGLVAIKDLKIPERNFARHRSAINHVLQPRDRAMESGPMNYGSLSD